MSIPSNSEFEVGHKARNLGVQWIREDGHFERFQLISCYWIYNNIGLGSKDQRKSV